MTLWDKVEEQMAPGGDDLRSRASCCVWAPSYVLCVVVLFFLRYAEPRTMLEDGWEASRQNTCTHPALAFGMQVHQIQF